jgi:hypothetical protein
MSGLCEKGWQSRRRSCFFCLSTSVVPTVVLTAASPSRDCDVKNCDGKMSDLAHALALALTLAVALAHEDQWLAPSI